MKKEFRLKSNQDFASVIEKRKSFANQEFIVYYSTNTIGHGRVGISTSKKLGNAVTRNRIRRQVRVMVDLNVNFENQTDIVIIVRKKFLDNSYQVNCEQFKKLLEKLKKEKNEKEN